MVDVVVGPLETRQPYLYISLPSPALEASRPIVHFLGFRASPKIPTLPGCILGQFEAFWATRCGGLPAEGGSR